MLLMPVEMMEKEQQRSKIGLYNARILINTTEYGAQRRVLMGRYPGHELNGSQIETARDR